MKKHFRNYWCHILTWNATRNFLGCRNLPVMKFPVWKFPVTIKGSKSVWRSRNFQFEYFQLDKVEISYRNFQLCRNLKKSKFRVRQLECRNFLSSWTRNFQFKLWLMRAIRWNICYIDQPTTWNFYLWIKLEISSSKKLYRKCTNTTPEKC